MGTYSYKSTYTDVQIGRTGYYEITAFGGQGGSDGSATGGFGAEVSGNFMLQAGERLRIFTGGAGGDSTINGGGGGGGSFVFAYLNGAWSPLLVAGGGGGGYTFNGSASPGSDARVTTGSGYGGAGGGHFAGGGGAGLKSSGGTGEYGGGAGGSTGTFSGGAGATFGGGAGGFGGGGGGGYGGGGGGGYSGGDGGNALGTPGGGGGDSFDAGAPDTAHTIVGYNEGAGSVSIRSHPSLYFSHGYKAYADGDGAFSIGPSAGAGTITDYNDGVSDDLTQVGDIANDQYDFVAAGQPDANASIGTFVASASNGEGFVGKFTTTNGSYYYLYTNKAHMQGDTIQAVAAPFVVCFASGTLIATSRGEVPVEHLAVGDLAVTASGAHRPIRWLGSRTIDCRADPRPYATRPVRITAHAFGPNRPARDLLVSPGHSVCVDLVGEVLVPAASLINGSTITQVDVDSITYWHVELGSHDILIADGLPAESYLEMGNRGFFAEAGVVDLAASPDAPPRTHADFCRPFHQGGPLVEVLRERLAARAQTLGWRLDHDDPFAGLHLVVDGARVEPRTRGLAAVFAVPRGARDVRLVSEVSRGRDIGFNVDTRALGVFIAALTIEDGFETRSIALDDPRLGDGFHDVEAGPARWTAGRAHLPAALWEESAADGFFLRVDLAHPALPRWVAPEVAFSVPAEAAA